VEEWLAQNGFLLGNALLSGVGLAFSIDAPARVRFRTAKNWWIVLWSGLLGFYLCAIILPTTLLPAIFNGISTASAAILYLYFHNRKVLKTRKPIITFCFVLSLVVLSGLFPLDIRSYSSVFAVFMGQILSWLFFVLLAWNYRKQHMATTILLLAYANLQLPAGLMGKQGLGVDFVLLLAGKLSLIGAMYHTLGVRDAKS
jgi:hypothetical protein